jgi:hypothetical protein
VGISAGSVEEILHNVLKVSKVSARWVPRLLSPEHGERRLVAITQLLQEGAEFLCSVVTCDETWVHYFTPESKSASKQWKHTHSPPPKKRESNFFSEEDHGYCVLGFKGYPSPGLSHLALSDYHLFGPMKGFLGGQGFQNNDKVIAAVQSWIHEQLKTFFETGIKKLPESVWQSAGSTLKSSA